MEAEEVHAHKSEKTKTFFQNQINIINLKIFFKVKLKLQN